MTASASKRNTPRPVYQTLIQTWLGPERITRAEIRAFSQGLISPHTLKELDRIGQGPASQIVNGRRLYHIADLVQWLEDRSSYQVAK